MVSAEGVGLVGESMMVHNDSQGKPLGATLHHLPRALSYVQSLTSHILAKRSDLLLCVQYESFGFHDSGILRLVQLHPVPARGDHSDLQVSLAQDTQNLHHISCFNIFVTCCHSMPWFVASDSTTANRRHSLAALFSLRLESWVSADACVDLALKSTRPCQNPPPTRPPPLHVYSPHSKKLLSNSCPNSHSELNASSVGTARA